METKSLTQNKAIVAFYLIGIFVAPPIMIESGIIPQTDVTNLIALTICTVLCLSIMLREGCKWRDFDTQEKEGAEMYYFSFTLFGIIFLIFMKELLSLEVNFEVLNREYFLLLFMPICFMQVLCYRVFLFKKLRLFTENRFLLVFISTLLFSGMHLMFSLEFFIICFFGGIGFGYVYLEYPNLKLMWISHSVLNFMAGMLGAFSPQ